MTSTTLAVIDYGMGNLHSVASAVALVAPDAQVNVTADPAQIAAADRVIFPGVGAIRDCIAEIKRLGLDSVVADVAESGKPMLAICVGLQALMAFSEENGGVECLGHFAGQVKAFSGYEDFNKCRDEGSSSGEHLKVPHMGWNQVVQKTAHPLWQNIPDNGRFYFVHSYCVQASQPKVVCGGCHYGIEFSAALAQNNVFAAQFHPEKSHANGLQLLRNFMNWNGELT